MSYELYTNHLISLVSSIDNVKHFYEVPLRYANTLIRFFQSYFFNSLNLVVRNANDGCMSSLNILHQNNNLAMALLKALTSVASSLAPPCSHQTHDLRLMSPLMLWCFLVTPQWCQPHIYSLLLISTLVLINPGPSLIRQSLCLFKVALFSTVILTMPSYLSPC